MELKEIKYKTQQDALKKERAESRRIKQTSKKWPTIKYTEQGRKLENNINCVH